jgi:DNA-binding response OmpR family regulator
MAKRVLVVDDDPQVVVIARVVLEQAGFEVMVASDGAECLDMIAKQRPGLVILDVAMPVMNGIEALRAIRQGPDTTTLPVIVLSARTEDRDVAVGQAAGADLYLAKPFTPEELTAAVNRLLDMAGERD